MCHGFQITYFNIQQLSIVLMIALLEHFNLEVNEKVSFNNTSETITEMAISQSQKNCIAYIKNDMIAT